MHYDLIYYIKQGGYFNTIRQFVFTLCDSSMNEPYILLSHSADVPIVVQCKLTV